MSTEKSKDRYNKLQKLIKKKYPEINEMHTNYNYSSEKYSSLQEIWKNPEKKTQITPGPKSDKKKERYLNKERKNFSYSKFLFLKEFEVTSNFAFECCKRRYPGFWNDGNKHYVELVFMYVLFHDKDIQINKLTNHLNDPLDIILLHLNSDSYYQHILDFLNSNSPETTLGYILKNMHLKYIVAANYDFYKNYIKSITPLFSSPFLIEGLETTIDIRLNFSLPEHELLEYVKYLKQNLIKTSNFELKSLNSPKKKYQDILGDILFIYDCKKSNIDETTIIYSIYEYYNKRDGTDMSISSTILSKYYKYAKLFIEENYLMELISNLKPIDTKNYDEDLINKYQEEMYEVNTYIDWDHASYDNKEGQKSVPIIFEKKINLKKKKELEKIQELARLKELSLIERINLIK